MANSSTYGMARRRLRRPVPAGVRGRGPLGAPRHRRHRRPDPRPAATSSARAAADSACACWSSWRSRSAERWTTTCPTSTALFREHGAGVRGGSGSAPQAEELDREGRFPARAGRGRRRSWGCWASRSRRSGAARAPTPWPTRSRSRSWPGSTARLRSPSQRTPRWARTPIHLFGTREQQERAGCPDLALGKRLAAFGLTEPGAGSDAGATRTTAPARGRRVGDRRLEDVHHQRRHRDLGPGDDHRPHRAGRDLEHRGRNGTAGYTQSAAAEEDGLALVGHARALASPAAGCRSRSPARPARRGLPPVPRDPRRWPHQRRRAGPGHGPGGVRDGARLRPVSASSSAARSGASRRSSSSWPTWRPRSRRPATWSTRPRG